MLPWQTNSIFVIWQSPLHDRGLSAPCGNAPSKRDLVRYHHYIISKLINLHKSIGKHSGGCGASDAVPPFFLSVSLPCCKLAHRIKATPVLISPRKKDFPEGSSLLGPPGKIYIMRLSRSEAKGPSCFPFSCPRARRPARSSSWRPSRQPWRSGSRRRRRPPRACSAP